MVSRLPLRGERGAVAVETAVVFPVLIFLLLGVIQFGVWYHAESVTRTAALEAARRVAAEGARASDGQARGQDLMRMGLGSLATNTRVSITIQSTLVRAEVRSSMSPILALPGFRSLSLRATGIARRERFHPAGERG